MMALVASTSSLDVRLQGAINYDPTKEVDDGSCTFVVPEFDAEDVVYGCTYAQATNYNPNATNDDGSCSFTSESCAFESNLGSQPTQGTEGTQTQSPDNIVGGGMTLGG